MCKKIINSMLWLALMSVVQNKHLPMLESQRYAVRQVNVCVVCVVCARNNATASFILFLPLSVLKATQFSGNFKANNGYFLANLR